MYSKKEAKRDAKRYAKAKMDYGDGAGVRRRHLSAELNKKWQDESYRESFEAELEKLDMDRIVRNLKTQHAARDARNKGKRVFRTVTGLSTAAMAGYTFYSNNKDGIDRMFNTIKVSIQNKINRRKYKNSTKIVSMTDAEKAAAYLKSVGIEAHYK